MHKIRELRESKAWTQQVLSSAACVSVRTIQRAESGQPVSKESLLSIASALDVEWSDLISNTVLRRRILRINIVGIAILLGLLLLSWVVYGNQLENQTRYWIRYQMFVALCASGSSGLFAVIAVWNYYYNYAFRSSIYSFCVYGVLQFLVFNLMPFIQYPHDQYAAAFSWMFTGAVVYVFVFLSNGLFVLTRENAI